MAKKKTKKAKKAAPMYVAVGKTWNSDPCVFKNQTELFFDIEEGNFSVRDYNFFEIGKPLKIEVKIIERPVTKKVTKVKGIK